MLIKSNKLKIAAGLVLILGMMLIPSWLWFHFNGINLCPEAMDCGQLARNISEGRGFTTGFIRPASLFFVDRISDPPDLVHPPLYSFLLSLSFRIGGASDKVIFLFSLALFWITGLLIVFLTRKIFNSFASFLVAFIYFTNAILLNNVLTGSPILLESLILVVLFFLLYYRKENAWWYFLIGIFYGVAYLSSYIWLWFAVPLIIYLLIVSRGMPGRRVATKLFICLGAGFILMVLGWWWRNWQITGNPFVNLGGSYKVFTAIFPGSSLLRETDLQIFGRLPSLKQLLFKWGEGSEFVYSRLLIITGSFLAPFFWIALITPFTDRRWSRIRFFLFGCLFMGICRYIICSRQIEDINIIIPLAIMAGTAAFVAIREKSGNLLKHIILMVFLGLNLFPFFDQLRITPISYPPTKNNLIRIERHVAEEEAIISDLPWAVAWYAERESVWLPSDPEGVSALLVRFPEIKYIYLTPETNRYRSSASRISWAEIYRNRTCSQLWKAEEIIAFPHGQFFTRITRENPRNP